MSMYNNNTNEWTSSLRARRLAKAVAAVAGSPVSAILPSPSPRFNKTVPAIIMTELNLMWTRCSTTAEVGQKYEKICAAMVPPVLFPTIESALAYRDDLNSPVADTAYEAYAEFLHQSTSLIQDVLGSKAGSLWYEVMEGRFQECVDSELNAVLSSLPYDMY